MTDDDSKLRVYAGQLAKTILDLAVSESADLTTSQHFWERLATMVLSHVPVEKLPVRLVSAPLVPMSDEESRKFGRSHIPFGKFAGKRVDEVELSYLLWLDRQPAFHYELSRYLASPRIAAEVDQGVEYS